MDKIVKRKVTDFFSTKTLRSKAKGSILIMAGENPKGIMHLLTGTVEQYHITPAGNKIVVNVFKPPAFFPMSLAINRTPNSYFYEALTDISFRQSTSEEVVRFLHENPDVTFNLLGRVYRGTDALLRRAVVSSSGAANNRLIFELIVEAYRFGSQLDDSHWQISLRQTVLSSRSGLARETVSRIIHALIRDGMIKNSKGGYIINVKGLETRLDNSV